MFFYSWLFRGVKLWTNLIYGELINKRVFKAENNSALLSLSVKGKSTNSNKVLICDFQNHYHS